MIVLCDARDGRPLALMDSIEVTHAELADAVTGRKSGRRSSDEITIFDSTGTALEDVAAAALMYERAVEAGSGFAVALGD